MTTKINNIIQSQLKTDLPDIRPGDLVKVWQKVAISAKTTKEKDAKKKERLTPFQGIVIAKKHGKGISATFTVRNEIKGIGCERIFPLHSPTLAKIEILGRHKTRRAKLYYLRTAKGKRARLKRKEAGASPLQDSPSKTKNARKSKK